MSLFVEGVEPSKIFSGEAAVASVFVGAEKVWPTAIPNTFELTTLGVSGLNTPCAVAFESETGPLRMWVGVSGTGEIEVIDVASGTSVASFEVLTRSATPAETLPDWYGGKSIGMYYDPIQGFMYACDYDAGMIHMLVPYDLSYADAIDLAAAPRSLAISNDGLTIYVSDGGTNSDTDAELHVINVEIGSRPTLQGTITVPGKGGGYVALTGDGRAYVSSVGGAKLCEVDLTTKQVTKTIDAISGQLAIANVGGTELLYVACGGMNQSGPARVDAYSTADSSLVISVDGFDGATTAIAVSPDNRRVYVATYVGKLTYQLDAETGEILDSDGSSQVRFELAVSPDSRYIATASLAGEGGGTVEVFETNYAGRGTPAP